MHDTTRMLLQALSTTSDNNDLGPAECWNEVGQSIYAWRQAGKPDLPRGPRKCIGCGHLAIDGVCLCQALTGDPPTYDPKKSAKDIVALIRGAPGPFFETETSFFGQKRTDPTMKDAGMETDMGGAMITKSKMTYGEAEDLAAKVNLAGYPAFLEALEPSAYWRSPYEKPKPEGAVLPG